MSGRERHYREDELRGLLEELDRQMRESEAVRGFAESQLRRKRCFLSGALNIGTGCRTLTRITPQGRESLRRLTSPHAMSPRFDPTSPTAARFIIIVIVAPVIALLAVLLVH